MRIEKEISVLLFAISLGNTITGIINNDNINYYLTHVAVFIIPAVIMFVVKINMKEDHISILMLISSIFAVITEPSTSLNSIFLLSYSLYLNRNSIKIYKVYGILYLIAFIIKFSFFYSSGTIVYVTGVILVARIYLKFIHPKKDVKETKKEYILSPVRKDVVDILDLVIRGYEYHIISDKLELNITADRVRRKVNEEVKRLGFNNREHMIYFLTEKGVIKSISYDVDTKSNSRDKV